MTTNILSIQPRISNRKTQTNVGWYDGFYLYQSGPGGIEAGAANAGNGALTINSVAPSTPLGTYIVAVTSLDGIARITLTDGGGSIIGRGVAGLPVIAGGISFTLAQGSTPFAVDDTFAIGVLPAPIDITGIDFVMQVRATQLSANVALTAASAPDDPAVQPTISTGGMAGTIGLIIPKASMAREKFAPGSYVYEILALADGIEAVAFNGTLLHVDGSVYLP